jgi:hypothetical protein
MPLSITLGCIHGGLRFRHSRIIHNSTIEDRTIYFNSLCMHLREKYKKEKGELIWQKQHR